MNLFDALVLFEMYVWRMEYLLERDLWSEWIDLGGEQ